MDRRAGPLSSRAGAHRNTTAASVAVQTGVGGNLSLFDSTGITEQIGSELKGWLLKNRAMDLVDPESLSDLDRRDATVLAQNNEDDALALMVTKLGADLVYYIKFQPVPAHQQTGEVIPYKMIAQIKDARRGRLIDSYSLNYRGSTDIHRTREYATELAKWFMKTYNDYVENRPRGLRYTVRVLGFDGDRQMVEARRVMRDIEDIKGKIKGTYVQNDGQSYGEYKIKYDGDAMDLSYDIQTILEEEMGLNITGLDTQGGIMLLRIGPPRPPKPKPVWQELLDPESQVSKDFVSAYEGKASPKIGVVISWLVNPQQMDADWQSTMPLVVMQGDPRLGNTVQGPDTIGLSDMEGMISEFFRKRQVTVIDPDQVRTVINKQANKLETLGEQGDFASLLRASDGFDVVVYGVASVTRGNLNSAEEIQYSFKIKDLRNGEFLGAQRWPDEEYQAAEIDSTQRDQVGAYVSARLLADIYENNLISAGAMEVTVKNAPDVQAVSRLARALDDHLEAVFKVSTPSFDNGVGRFTARYTGPATAITDALDEVTGPMPFTLTVNEADGGKLVVSVQSKDLPSGDE